MLKPPAALADRREDARAREPGAVCSRASARQADVLAPGSARAGSATATARTAAAAKLRGAVVSSDPSAALPGRPDAAGRMAQAFKLANHRVQLHWPLRPSQSQLAAEPRGGRQPARIAVICASSYTTKIVTLQN